MKHYDIKIHGDVHGVGYRFSAQAKARELDLVGFVRNEPDKTVYIEAEGEEENLKKFMEWCNEGPLYAKIKKIESSEGKVQNFNAFEIKD
ncbi:MAG TPA: acylphosphatase [Patescibacteria group bacterium]|jgi:acylphosphatase|nr:acylphosphatase [Patescibacteria group bacterium]